MAALVSSNTISFGGMNLKVLSRAMMYAYTPSTTAYATVRCSAFPPIQRSRSSFLNTTHQVGSARPDGSPRLLRIRGCELMRGSGRGFAGSRAPSRKTGRGLGAPAAWVQRTQYDRILAPRPGCRRRWRRAERNSNAITRAVNAAGTMARSQTCRTGTWLTNSVKRSFDAASHGFMNWYNRPRLTSRYVSNLPGRDNSVGSRNRR